MLEEERTKYENGKKFLARLMGQDPSSFNQDDVDEAIRYLFPSGLQSTKAHPKLKVICNCFIFRFSRRRRYIRRKKVCHPKFYC